MVSVIIPTYNRAEDIGKAIRSVLKQTYQDIEIIIIDDASTDGTKDIILKEMEDDNRIFYYNLERNMGACCARNIGISKAKGSFIAFLDSDDEWNPYKLEKQMKKIYEEKADCVFCKAYYVKGKEKVVFPSSTVDMENFYKQQLKENCITTGALLVKKECLENQYFDKELPKFQDWDLTLRLAQNYLFVYCDEPLITLYFKKDSITATTSYEKAVAALKLIEKKHINAKEYDKYIKAEFAWKIAKFSLGTNNIELRYFRQAIRGKYVLRRFIIYILLVSGFRKKIKKILLERLR